MNYIFHITVLLEVYILLALSANQQVGLSGLLTMAQAVFYGVGAYTTAILMTRYGVSFWITLPITVCVSFLAAIVVSYIAGRVRNLYFSLATLSLQIIFFSAAYNWVGLTNGPYGISGISSPQFFGFAINTPGTFAVFGLIWVIAAVLFYGWFLKTPLSRMIEATRDDQIAVLSLGKNPTYYKTLSVALSAIVAGIAGSLYATYTTYIDPTSFGLDESILILSIVLIGGAGGLWGPISGAAIYILLPEILKFVHLPDSVAANMRMIIFGLLLVPVVRFRPQGILGKYQISQ